MGGGGELNREGALNRGNTVFDIYGPLPAALMRFPKNHKNAYSGPICPAIPLDFAVSAVFEFQNLQVEK